MSSPAANMMYLIILFILAFAVDAGTELVGHFSSFRAIKV